MTEHTNKGITLQLRAPRLCPNFFMKYRNNVRTLALKLRHSDLSSQDNISLAGWNGAMREAIVNLFVLFPVAAGRFMIREAKQDDCGLNAGINTVSYVDKRFSEQKNAPQFIKNKRIDAKKPNKDEEIPLTPKMIKCTV